MKKFFLLTTTFKIIYLGEFISENKGFEEAVDSKLKELGEEALAILDRDEFQKLHSETVERNFRNCFLNN